MFIVARNDTLKYADKVGNFRISQMGVECQNVPIQWMTFRIQAIQTTSLRLYIRRN